MLQAFVDDSGTANPPVFVLAGFVANVNQWEALTMDWEAKVLKGDPPITHFRMNDAWRQSGQFARMDTTRRDARVTTCLSLVEQHHLVPIRTVIPHAAYKDVFVNQISRRMNNPYYLAFYAIMAGVLLGLDKTGHPDTIDFVFDEPGTKSGEEYKVLVDGFDAFLKNGEPNVIARLAGRPSHKKDTDILPLQVADFYSWHVRRFYDERASGRDFDNPVWTALSRIQGGLEIEMDRAWLASMLQRMYERNAAKGRVFPYQLPPKDRKRALKQKRT